MDTSKEPWRRPVEIPHLPPLRYSRPGRADTPTAPQQQEPKDPRAQTALV